MADLMSPELQAQLDELGRELDVLSEKKNRYKNQLKEEREKNTVLQSQYFDQLQKRDEADRIIDEVKAQADDDRCQLSKTVATLTVSETS